jgi:SpoVK/Ycf46/Vps4 family AAA+-type ATPase
MVSARQMIALLTGLNEGNDEQVYAIALQVAATEARRGRVEVANELQNLVAAARGKRDSRWSSEVRRGGKVVVPITQPRGELQNLLTSSDPSVTLANLTLSPEIKARLELFIRQQRERDRLRSFNRTPASRLLLMGPSGSGKTLTASALAGELHLPLHVIRLDTVITRFMGETATKLRLIFDQVGMSRGVYLFDEFDAIGSKRTADNDVGEMRRVLNSFLQFMEEENSTDSVITAATNHPQLLDEALFRRFDDIIRYDLPDAPMIEMVLRDRLISFDTGSVDWDPVRQAGISLSQAEVVKAADEVVRDMIIRKNKTVTSALLVSALDHRRKLADRK